MNREITMGSLFDGIAGFPLAAERNGIRPIWASEIEPFPIAVSKQNVPYMQHLGDIKNLDGELLPPVDVVTGGSPCQNLSIAGKREGLYVSQSSLFLEQVRIIKEMRENDIKSGRKAEEIRPRIMVWENVPGAFSPQKERTLGEFSKKSVKSQMKPLLFLDLQKTSGLEQGALWEKIFPLLGGCWMLDIGESHKDVKESFLSQILEDNVHQKYYLTPAACQRILRRAGANGRQLPKNLEEALQNQSQK